jgi:HSP20 family molecular chaperone IbpA
MTENNETLSVKNENEVESAHPGKIFVPHADIIETDESIVIRAEMPGVDDDSIDVTLENNVLSIDGSVAASHFEGYSLAYAEYEGGSYQRSFTLSDRIDRDNIEATVSNGVLSLTLSKIDLPQPKKIEVQAA